MKFEYERKTEYVEAYGNKYPMPTKTAVLVDEVNAIQERIKENKNENKSAADMAAALRDGIAVFIGENETERIFPKEKLNELDTDELTAFWWVLNEAANKATKDVIEKYSPNREIKKPPISMNTTKK